MPDNQIIDARPIPQTPDELTAFIRALVRKALREVVCESVTQPPRAVCPPMDVTELPAWARYEEGTH